MKEEAEGQTQAANETQNVAPARASTSSAVFLKVIIIDNVWDAEIILFQNKRGS